MASLFISYKCNSLLSNVSSINIVNMPKSEFASLAFNFCVETLGGYSESGMVGGYTQSPGGFASPGLSQGEKKGVRNDNADRVMVPFKT